MAFASLNFLFAEDAKCASRTFAKLLPHEIRNWALPGGLAIELPWTNLTGQTSRRPLKDVDFMVDSFDASTFCPGAVLPNFLTLRHTA